MKKIMPVLAAFIVIGAVLMVSCDKDETSTSFSINLLKKATIKVYAYAQLDLTTAGLEKAPAGTKVIISIPYNEFNTSVSGIYKDTAAINSEGFFEIEVPVGNESATVSLIPLPFETNQVQALGSLTSPIKKYYTVNKTDISLSAGDYKIVEITYITNTYANFVETAQISGVLRAETDDAKLGEEPTTSGISLIFHGNGWNKTVTTTDGGAYSVVVSASETVYVDYSFTATRKIGILTPSYLFEKTNQSLSSFNPNSVNKLDISAGSGVLAK
jgi:hypothetical protein